MPRAIKKNCLLWTTCEIWNTPQLSCASEGPFYVSYVLLRLLPMIKLCTLVSYLWSNLLLSKIKFIGIDFSDGVVYLLVDRGIVPCISVFTDVNQGEYVSGKRIPQPANARIPPRHPLNWFAGFSLIGGMEAAPTDLISWYDRPPLPPSKTVMPPPPHQQNNDNSKQSTFFLQFLRVFCKILPPPSWVGHPTPPHGWWHPSLGGMG